MNNREYRMDIFYPGGPRHPNSIPDSIMRLTHLKTGIVVTESLSNIEKKLIEQLEKEVSRAS